MGITRTALIGQLESIIDGTKAVKFKPLLFDGKKYNALLKDSGETGISTTDNSWFIPLVELTNAEMIKIKTAITARKK